VSRHVRVGTRRNVASAPRALPAPTAPLAAASLIAGYAVAAATGSRPLGGVVLAAGGLGCVEIWRRRHGVRTPAGLGAAGLIAFAASHVLAGAIGAWPSVLTVAAAIAVLAWRFADSRPAEAQADALRA
jgi:hypothetical protein